MCKTFSKFALGSPPSALVLSIELQCYYVHILLNTTRHFSDLLVFKFCIGQAAVISDS